MPIYEPFPPVQLQSDSEPAHVLLRDTLTGQYRMERSLVSSPGCVAVSPDAKYVAVSSKTSTPASGRVNTEVINLETGGRTTLSVPNQTADLTFMPDGRLIWMSKSAKVVRVFDPADWSYTDVSGLPGTSYFGSVTWTPDMAYIFVSNSGSTAAIDASTLGVTSTLSVGNHSTFLSSLVYDPAYERLLLYTTGAIRGYPLIGGIFQAETIVASSGFNYPSGGMAMSPDGSRIFSCAVQQYALRYATLNRSGSTFTVALASSNIGTSQDTPYCPVFIDDNTVFVYGPVASRTVDVTTHATSTALRYSGPVVAAISMDTRLHTGATPARFIRGSVSDKDGLPAARKVVAFERSTGLKAGETVSDAVTGEYELEVYRGDVEYDLKFEIATGEALNDLFFARALSSET